MSSVGLRGLASKWHIIMVGKGMLHGDIFWLMGICNDFFSASNARKWGLDAWVFIYIERAKADAIEYADWNVSRLVFFVSDCE